MIRELRILFGLFVITMVVCMAIVVLAGIPAGETRWPEVLIVSLLALIGITLVVRSRGK